MINASLDYQNSAGNKRSHTGDQSQMDKKKIKQEENPSKVIHMREIPFDATEYDIKQLGQTFGKVTNILFMKNKGQAFLELSDIDSAKTMINYYSYVAPAIKTQPIKLQYSQHQELITNNANSRDDKNDGMENGGRPSGTVLKVIVTNIVYPVNIDVLQQVFQRCGEIQKVVTFIRNDQFNALIQYSNPKEAAAAKNLFHNQNIYNGCNTLHVENSKMAELKVKYNNEKMRDFTKPDRPNMDPMNAQLQAMQAQMNPGMLPVPGSFAPQLFPQVSTGGFPNMMSNLSPGAANMNFNNSFMNNHQMQRGGSVLLVSNLNEDDINCDDLFILFGHYGDVQRVKILYNKKDTALIQFSDANQASTAQQNLNNVTLYGKDMRVSRSKHDNVNMPKSEDEGRELTKEYSNSPLHRFKKPGSKNFQNIFPPIRTLHLSNIPESISEEELQEMFSEHGAISNFRFFPKDRRMALMQLGSIEEAMICLIKLHNKKLNESSHLRVSFAKTDMN